MAESTAYQVVARRYRPQRFDELVGQEHVARGLSGAIESGRIGHAYLFTGARGVGKTSAARIYAKALECGQGPAAEPCNVCESCQAISAGQDVDVVEIDAASNRGIDEIRQLRQNVAVRPARGRFKIYIIDEVHMLTREAFNALLKTLEEPPAHVKFVLCTTEPEKLPITILSRCQRFDFQTVDAPAISRRLAQIVEAEGAAVEPVALDLIARRAAGSMRDSQSLLEQLLGSATGPIGLDDVHAVIGTGREEQVGRLVAAIAAHDPRAALEALDAALAGGADAGGVLEQLIAAFRDSLLASVGCGPEALLQGDGLGVDLATVGRGLGTETLLAMLQIIDHALARMRTSGHAAVLAEMAVVRLAKLEDLESLTAIVQALPVEKGAASAPPVAANAARERALPPPALPARQEPEREKKTTDLTPVPAAVVPPVDRGAGQETASESAAPVAALLPADAFAAWQQAGAAVGGLAVDFAALATRCSWREDLLEVAFPADAAAAASFLRRPEVAAGITRVLAETAGRPLRHTILIDAAAPAQPPSSAPSNGGPGPQQQEPPERPRAAHSQVALLREALDHPLVTHARTLFDAAVRKVEPPRTRELAVAVTAAADPAEQPENRGAEEFGGPDA